MAKRKKRNALTLISLLLTLAALMGFYLWYTNREKTSPGEGEDSDIALSSINTDDVTALHYVYGDTDLTLVKEGDTWVSETDKNRPINQDRVKSLLGVIDEISATRLIAESADRLADFGLDQPEAYLQATLGDASAVTLKIGDKSAAGDGYYALVNEDNKVYLLASSYGSGLKYTDSDMTAVATSPKIEAANIRHINIDMRDGEDFELLYQEDNDLDNSKVSMFPWVILKPYPQVYTAESSAVTSLQGNYTSFNYIKCVEYSVKDLELYGLGQPMATIVLGYLEERTEKLEEPEKNPETGEEISEKTYYDDKEFKLFIGNQDESGNYYVKTDGDNAVYTLSKDTVDKMITVDTFSLLNKFVAIPNIEQVDKIEADIGGTVYTMNMERTSVKNEKGEDEVKTAYFYNGAEVEEDAFKTVYQGLISARYDAEIKEEINTDSSKPYLTVSFYLSDAGKTVLTASYLPYNDSFYIIQNGREKRFFADKRSIDDIVKAVVEFKTKE